jgi:glycerol-3-phosphate acyltransferase PlsX
VESDAIKVYVRYLRPDIRVPRVGLINIGEEPNKGTSLLRETYQHMAKASLNFEFVGNVEPHNLFAGKVQVIICDGFVGNLILKMAEGVKGFILHQFSNGMSAGPELQQAVNKATEKLDYSEYGGALVMGVRGIVIKAHGRSRARAVTNAIKLAAKFIEDKLNDHIVDEVRRLSRTTWFAKWFSWSKEDE